MFVGIARTNLGVKESVSCEHGDGRKAAVGINLRICATSLITRKIMFLVESKVFETVYLARIKEESVLFRIIKE